MPSTIKTLLKKQRGMEKLNSSLHPKARITQEDGRDRIEIRSHNALFSYIESNTDKVYPSAGKIAVSRNSKGNIVLIVRGMKSEFTYPNRLNLFPMVFFADFTNPFIIDGGCENPNLLGLILYEIKINCNINGSGNKRSN